MSRSSIGFANESHTLDERVVHITASLTLDPAKHANRTLVVTANTGAVAITMPAAVGSGDKYHIHLDTAVSGGITVVAGVHNGTSNKFVGRVVNVTSAGLTVLTFASTTNDLITINGTTQGGAIAGDYLVLQDTALGVWKVLEFVVQSSGNAATPFSG
jgi:hypothetical protein